MSTLWVGTRKGLFALRTDARRRTWKLAGPQFLGHIIHHVVQDPRAPRTVLMAAKTGHLGPTVFRSGDRGRTWREAAQPPAFRKAADGEAARAVERVFWLTPGHAGEPGVWYAGSSPAGLFRSANGGESWEPVAGFNDHPTKASRPWDQARDGFVMGEGAAIFLMKRLADAERDGDKIYAVLRGMGVSVALPVLDSMVPAQTPLRKTAAAAPARG